MSITSLRAESEGTIKLSIFCLSIVSASILRCEHKHKSVYMFISSKYQYIVSNIYCFHFVQGVPLRCYHTRPEGAWQWTAVSVKWGKHESTYRLRKTQTSPLSKCNKHMAFSRLFREVSTETLKDVFRPELTETKMFMMQPGSRFGEWTCGRLACVLCVYSPIELWPSTWTLCTWPSKDQVFGIFLQKLYFHTTF